MIECNEDVKASKATISRLPIYLRCLRKSLEAGEENVSSTRLAEYLKLNPVQVRKDIALVSPKSGKPKLGFATRELIEAIEDVLGCNNTNDALLVGVGGLGSTLLAYDGFKNYGLNIVAAFDVNPELAGSEINGIKVFPIEKLAAIAERLNVKMGIITVPASSAQDIADKLVESGILAIWSFAPTRLDLPENIAVKYEDLAASLAVLSSKLKDAVNPSCT